MRWRGPFKSFCGKTRICFSCIVNNRTESLPWRHNGREGFSNHEPRHCLHSRLSRRRSKKTSKLRVTGLCVGNSPVAGEFPAQMASYAVNVSIDDVIMVRVDTRRKSISNRGVDLVLSEYDNLSNDGVKCTIAATVAIDSYDQNYAPVHILWKLLAAGIPNLKLTSASDLFCM